MSTGDPDEFPDQGEGEEGTSSGAGAFSLWGLGASVLGSVQKNTTTFVNTIVETDWKKELQEIQDGLRNETAGLEKDIGTRLAVAQTDTTDRSSDRPAPARSDADGVSIADIGRRLLTGTAEIFQQVRAHVDSEFTNLEQEATKKPRSSLPRGREGGAKFSRLDMKISAMQRNSATYCDEPDDAEAYAEFLSQYDEPARTAQAEDIMSSNPFMSELHSRLVPLVITDDTFWQRYFFRLQKLTEEYEKVQERLQQAHRRASKQEPENEPLDDFPMLGTIPKAEASPVTNPTAVPVSEPQLVQHTPAEASVETGDCPEAKPSGDEGHAPAASVSDEDAGADSVVPHHSHTEQLETQGDGDGAEGAAGYRSEPVAARHGAMGAGQGPATLATHVPEHVAASGLQAGDGRVDAEEGNDSARSSGHEKISSDWSVVSPTGDRSSGAAAVASPQQKAQQPSESPAVTQEAAAQPAGAEPAAGTPDESTATHAGAEDDEDEDVDFDELEDGLVDGEDVDESAEVDEEHVDDNWGWE